jgi:hypothetical protein
MGERARQLVQPAGKVAIGEMAEAIADDLLIRHRLQRRCQQGFDQKWKISVHKAPAALVSTLKNLTADPPIASRFIGS